MELFAREGVAYGDELEVVITGEGKEAYRGDVAYVPSFGAVPKGAPLLMNSEMHTIQIAINQGNMTERYRIGCGPDWRISFRRK
jgi:S-adenosylmethionine hydrolase